jgi:hypothetical protein
MSATSHKARSVYVGRNEIFVHSIYGCRGRPGRLSSFAIAIRRTIVGFAESETEGRKP